MQAGFRKDRGTTDQIANIHWLIEIRTRARACVCVCVCVCDFIYLFAVPGLHAAPPFSSCAEQGLLIVMGGHLTEWLAQSKASQVYGLQ